MKVEINQECFRFFEASQVAACTGLANNLQLVLHICRGMGDLFSIALKYTLKEGFWGKKDQPQETRLIDVYLNPKKEENTNEIAETRFKQQNLVENITDLLDTFFVQAQHPAIVVDDAEISPDEQLSNLLKLPSGISNKRSQTIFKQNSFYLPAKAMA